MINPSCLPCQAHMSPTSAAQLTLPDLAVPSGLSHAGPEPYSVLESQLRRLLQEVFQGYMAGSGLDSQPQLLIPTWVQGWPLIVHNQSGYRC